MSTTKPERFTLPKTIGQKIEFPAHGGTFYVKKKSASDFVLMHDQNKQRSRWGNSTEIRQDIAHVLTYGTLPKPGEREW